jgi:hypothetical protein
MVHGSDTREEKSILPTMAKPQLAISKNPNPWLS